MANTQLQNELGHVAYVFLKDGSGFLFKPMEFNQLKRSFFGTDEEDLNRTVLEDQIEGVIHFKKVKWN